jgi:hypothetical protein
MFRPEKNNVHHIWGYPMMFRPKKNNVQHIWGCPTMMYRWKKTMLCTFGAVQRWCFAGKKRCSPHLGLGKIDV